MDPSSTFTGKPISGHRRSHSDTLFNFQDNNNNNSIDNLFDNLDFSEPNTNNNNSSHFRSLSVGSDDFFDGFDFSAGEYSESERSGGGGGGGKTLPPAHRHSNSMDGFFDVEVESMKKGMAPDRLAQLALIDPKRAKRILANRQSAARSKERKIRYTGELERKVQTLQSEATNLSAQVTMLQRDMTGLIAENKKLKYKRIRDTTGLTAENKELKYKLQAMEQQAHLRDALSEALKDEVNRLKIAAGQIPAANGNPFNRDLPPQFSSRPPVFQNFSNNQNQQIHMSQSANNQTPSSQHGPTFMDFNHRVK